MPSAPQACIEAWAQPSIHACGALGPNGFQRSTVPAERVSNFWRKARRVTGILLLLWFCVTLLTCLYASELNAYRFLGFPVCFYFAAQGALIVFLAIVGFYAWYMNRLDSKAKSASSSDSL